MEYIVADNSAGRIVSLTGHLTFREQKAYRSMLGELFSESKKSYVIDLDAVNHIDSAGLGMLLIARKYAKKNGADVILRRPPADIRMTLELAKFHELFTIES